MAMSLEERDRLVRLGAFDWLARQIELRGDVLPISVLRQGFVWEGQRVPLMGPQGIFKPAVLPGAPLSITTVPVVEGRSRPYEDEVGPDGFLRYRYRGTDPGHHENVGLRLAMERQLPLVYLFGTTPGWYRPEWPVFIVGDDPSTLTFTVAMDDPQALRPDLTVDVVDEARRRYVTRLARHRLHQLAFRQRVLRAYRDSCTVCRLHHVELLDAAHIRSDTHPQGEPVVTNGLAMCKLHHAAFDRQIVGIRPDYVVEIRHDVLDEIDGPMFRHGLQDLHGRPLLVVPSRRSQHPDAEALAERYETFRAAG
jgi:putative restriction endonuclease